MARSLPPLQMSRSLSLHRLKIYVQPPMWVLRLTFCLWSSVTGHLPEQKHLRNHNETDSGIRYSLTLLEFCLPFTRKNKNCIPQISSEWIVNTKILSRSYWFSSAFLFEPVDNGFWSQDNSLKSRNCRDIGCYDSRNWELDLFVFEYTIRSPYPLLTGMTKAWLPNRFAMEPLKADTYAISASIKGGYAKSASFVAYIFFDIKA